MWILQQWSVAIELSATKYCPAQAMLSKACKIEHKYSIKDAK